MTEQIDDRDRAAVPAGYRSLLLTYTRAWRAEHSEIVLDTVLTLHADTGRTRPGVAERLRFAIDGPRVRFAPEHPARPVHRFASAASLAPLRSFDQTNGIVSDGRGLSASGSRCTSTGLAGRTRTSSASLRSPGSASTRRHAPTGTRDDGDCGRVPSIRA